MGQQQDLLDPLDRPIELFSRDDQGCGEPKNVLTSLLTENTFVSQRRIKATRCSRLWSELDAYEGSGSSDFHNVIALDPHQPPPKVEPWSPGPNVPSTHRSGSTVETG